MSMHIKTWFCWSTIEHEMIVIKVNNDVFANIFNSGTNAVVVVDIVNRCLHRSM